jgi:hypothetical protein
LLANKKAALTALKVYEKENIDFVDSLLFGYYIHERVDIATFDIKLQKMLTRD